MKPHASASQSRAKREVRRSRLTRKLAALEQLERRLLLASDTLNLDFNLGVDDRGASNGDLVFQGPRDFTVTFRDDGSDGEFGGDAAGVQITNQGFGNIKAGSQNDFVVGAFNSASGASNFHSSGIVAEFNRGVDAVSFTDTDDDTTLKTLFAFDASGNLIGQTAAASQVPFSIDTSSTGGKLIHSIEFDTVEGTAGGSADDTFFTIDDFEVSYRSASFPLPLVDGDGVSIDLYNGIGGGRAPVPADVDGIDPSGVTLSPIIDFPSPGQTIRVGQSFNTFFNNTTIPPDQVTGLAASNFILDHEFYLAATQAMDLDPSTPEIDFTLSIGSDDGFHLTFDDQFLGSTGDRGFLFSNFDISVPEEGLYPVRMLFAANSVGFSGLELWWTTANGNELVPQSSMYIDPNVGTTQITFEELPGGTEVSNQFAESGIVFETVDGNLQITDIDPTGFVPISAPFVYGDVDPNPEATGQVDLTFVVPGTNTLATTDFFSVFVIDAETTGAAVTAFDQAGNTIFSQSVNAGGATQELVTIREDGIARISITLGNGTDKSAIDNLTFNTPTAQLPDLQAAAVTDSLIALSQETIGIQYQVNNIGPADFDSGRIDAVYLSQDEVLDRFNDTAIGTLVDFPSVPSGDSQSYAPFVTLPEIVPGDYFLLVSLNDDEFVNEFGFDNNVASISIRIPESAPIIVNQIPSGTTREDISRIELEVSEAIQFDGANDVNSYELLDLGPDRQPGGGDDRVIDLAATYLDGTNRIDLSPVLSDSIDLNAWVERDYAGNGSAGNWTVASNGESVFQSINGSPTFYVSDFDFIDREFVGRIAVETTGDDDYIGVAFGVEINQSNNRPDDYYLLNWKQGNQGAGEAGFKLLKVTNSSGFSSINSQLWDGENATFGAGRMEVLARNTASNLGWADNTEYEFSFRYESNGDIAVEIRRASDGAIFWQTTVNDPNPLGPGKVAFYNYSQSSVRYSGLQQSDFLPEGAYQLRVVSGDGAIENPDDVPLDGDPSVPGFEDYVSGFVIDQTVPIIEGITINRSNVNVDFFDAGGLDSDTSLNAANYVVLGSGGDGTFDDGNEITIAINSLTEGESQTVQLGFGNDLPDDLYQITVSGVTDNAGNEAAAQTVSLELLTGPAEIAVDLQDSSDSGVSSTDNLTSNNTPTFDITINKPGLLEIDFDGDGIADVSQLVATADPIEVTSPLLADGSRTVEASLTPAIGEPAIARLPLEIDTLGPAVLPGAANEQGPVSSRLITFSEAVDIDSISPLTVQMSGPDGAVALNSISGSGDTFTLAFETITRGGIYEITAPTTLTDLAGNRFNQDGDGVNGELGQDEPFDTFALLEDTTKPRIVDFTPIGATNQDISQFTAVFDEAIDPASFTISDLTITVPGGGTIDAGINIARLDSERFQVTIPSQSAEGDYVVAIGPSITDISGNPLSDDPGTAFSATLTIDQTGPQVSQATPSGNASTPLQSIEVIFDSNVDPSSISSADVNLTDPNGDPIPVTVSPIGSDRAVINFAEQRVNGDYRLQVGPDITDSLGNDMSRNAPGAFATTITLQLPDIAFSGAVVLGSTEAVFGDDLSVDVVLTNVGTADAFGPWEQRVLLSSDATLDGDDLVIGSFEVGAGTSLSPGDDLPLSVTATIPVLSSLTAGTYHVFVVADSEDAVDESDESNNSASTTVTLTPPPLPDLVAVSIDAPSSAIPGTPFSISWSTDNIGAASAEGPWEERVYLVDPVTLEEQLLGTISTDDTLTSGDQAIERQLTVTLPDDGLAGDLLFVIEVDGFDNVVESDEANRFSAAANTTVPLVLSLSAATTVVTEGGETIQATLTRNGSTDASTVVDLVSIPTGQLDTESQVTIPAGQSSIRVDVSAVIDSIADGDAIVELNATSDGFRGAIQRWNVIDTDIPTLELSLTSVTVQEGGLVTATVTRDLVTDQAIVVSITSSDANQLGAPASVTIPPNQPSVNFVLSAIEDDFVETDLLFTVDVDADDFEGDQSSLTILGNDVPTLAIALPADALAEGASGPTVQGRVTRDSATSEPLDIQLTVAPTALVNIPASIQIPANELFVEFPITVLEDDLVNPPRSVEFTARTISDFNDVVLTAGSSTATLDILDNDGPTLSVIIDRSLVSENGSTTARVVRNTDTTTALAVTLATSDDTEATPSPTSIEILAGETSAEFVINGVNDQTTDGNQSVSVRASAVGFTDGVGTVVITDVDLPDLVVTELSAPGDAATNESVDVTWSILNDGFATADGTWIQRLFLSSDNQIGNDTLLGQFSFTGPLAVGQSYDRTVSVPLPNVPGEYFFVLQSDVTSAIAEGLESNNARITADAIDVVTAYSATVSTEVEIAPADTKVLMTGTATRLDGSPASFEQVKVDLLVRGTKRTFPAITDALGNFQVNFTPLPGEGGIYTIGASHPGVEDAPVQDSFQLIGMRAEPPSVSENLVEAGPAKTGGVTIRNLSEVPLTGVSIQTIGDVPENLSLSFNFDGGASEIAANGTGSLNYSLSALNSTITRGTIRLLVSSNEAPDIIVPINFSVTPLVARLVAEPGALTKSMLVGDQTAVDVRITNTGGIETGPLEILLPSGADWLTLATPENLPSLQPGESTGISLLLTPPSDLPLTAYNGSFVVVGENANVSIPFNFRAVSDQTGDLQVTIVDEFHYFTEEQPLVDGASVLLRDAITGAVLAESVSSGPSPATIDPDITVSVDLLGRVTFAGVPEGPYTLEVRSPDHEVVSTTVRIASGRLNREEIFISRNLVEYTWTVEEVEIEDRTRVTIDASFETNVPAPVVTVEGVIDLADLQVVGQSQQFNITVTNHGLIAAEDVALDFGSHPFYEIVPLIETIGVLPAKSELVIPVTVRRIADFDPAVAMAHGLDPTAAGSVPCNITAVLIWTYDCGPNDVRRSATIAIINVEGNCAPGSPIRTRPSSGGRGGPAGPGGVSPVTIQSPDVDCQDCEEETWTLSVGESGIVNRVINAAADILEVAPPVDSLDFNVEGSVSWETCCEDDEEVGSKLSGEGSGSVTAGFNVPLLGADIDFIENLPVRFPAGAQVDVDLRAGLFLSGEVSGSIYGNAETDCEDWTDVTGCAGVRVSGQLQASVQAGINVDVEYLGKEYDFIISVSGGIRGSAEAFAQICFDNGETEFDWAATIGAVELFGAATFSVGTETAELFEIDNGVDINFEISQSIFDGCTWSKDNPGGTCGAEGSGLGFGEIFAGLSAAPDLSAELSGTPGTMPINPITGEVIDTSVTEFFDPDELASDVGLQDLDNLRQQLGRDDLDLGTISNDEWQGLFEDIRTVATPDVQGSGVCAVVALQIVQEAVQTRQGFQATLELSNGLSQSLQGIGVEIVITDEDGEDVSDAFAVLEPELTLLSEVSGFGTLAPQSTGSAIWTIIPTTDAAMEGNTEYFVGGTLQYNEAGTTVRIPLAPASITVVPQPELTLDYFLQRDVISDDPFTDPIEPAEPFTLAVQVVNNGFGAAENLRIESAQPKIIENEKGLLIDFEIIGTQINGADVERTLTANIGTLAAGGLAIAEWKLESTLQGLFVEYEATFEHLSGLGDERLSFIKSVEIHELIRTVDASQVLVDALPDFLVNDLPDPFDSPDTLYLSDGSTAEVSLGSDALADGVPTVEDLLIDVTAQMDAGWSYLKFDDPSNGQFQLIEVRRSDGTSLPENNFWQTDRTFVGGGQRPVLENKIHLLDFDSTGSYTFVFSNGDLEGPTVEEISGVDPNPTSQAVETLQVEFSEALRPGTFDGSDIQLTKNGDAMILPPGVSVVNLERGLYEIRGLASSTSDDGVYELTVFAAGVTDQVGNAGLGLGEFTWVKGEAAPAVLEILGAPDGLTTSSIDALDIRFTEPIQLATLTPTDFSILRDGVELVDDEVSISQIGDDTYRLSGLSILTELDGDYVFQIDAAGVQDLGGDIGIGTSRASWTLDATAPVIVDVIEVATNPRNTVVQRIDVEFSEPIDLSTFNVDDLTLTRDADPQNLIDGDARITIENRFGSVYRIQGINWVQSVEGIYSLTVLGAGINDEAGNASQGSESESWTIDLTRPAGPTDLQLSTASGPVVNGLVNSLSAELSGVLDEPDLRVIVRDLSTGEDLAEQTFSQGAFTLPFQFESPGSRDLRVRTVDPAGNTQDVLVEDLFVQLSGPVVSEIIGAPAGPTSASIPFLDIRFVDAIDAGSLTVADLQLSVNGGANLLDGTSTTISAQPDGLTYRLEGLDALSLAPGLYEFVIDVAGVDNPVGVPGLGTVSESWLLDNIAPQSSVTPLSAISQLSSFTVSVSGSDLQAAPGVNGSGIVSFDVFVSENGQPFTLWQSFSPETPTGNFVGIEGNRYSFYSIATDAAGNSEPVPNSPDTTTVVAGGVSVGSIGDFVWLDANANGVQDDGELGAGDIQVRLLAGIDGESLTPLASVQTQPDGSYSFDDLDTTLTYAIEVTAPDGSGFSPANAVLDDLVDSDVNIVTGRSEAFTILSGSNSQWDVGLIELGSISGTLWSDANGNGLREDDEDILSGWTVYLDLNDNGVLDEEDRLAMTGVDGSYSFSDLRPGEYVVAQVVQDGFAQTFPGPGGASGASGSETITVTNSTAELFSPANALTPADQEPANTVISLDGLRNDPRFSDVDGSDYAVVVIDSGIDLDHSFFGPDADGDGIADRIVYQYDFANDDTDASDVSGHGSHVSSVIASEDASVPGIAPGADIIHLKVFGDDGTGTFGDVERALQWVIENAAAYNIAAVNLSLGDGFNWSREVGLHGVDDELAALANLNVITVAAAGNSFGVTGAQGLSYPAADPNTISVGAVWDADRGGPWWFGQSGTDYTTGADRIASFSQRHVEMLDVFAPGALINGANAFGGTSTMRGTSMATSFATGAAVLSQQIAADTLGRRLTTEEFRYLLSVSGAIIVDGDDEDDDVPNTGGAFVRLDLSTLAEAVYAYDGSFTGSIAKPSTGSGLPTVGTSNSRPGRYTIQLAPDQDRTDVNFGNQPVDQVGPEVTDVIDVTPDPRTTSVASATVTFNEPIDLATFDFQDISLTRNGSNIALDASVTVALISDATYQINGLAAFTSSEGDFALSVDGAGINDLAGNAGTGQQSDNWITDTTSPTSSVEALPPGQSDRSFAVSVSGTDPASAGVASGVSSYEIYRRVNDGNWELWTTVPADNPIATYEGESDQIIRLYSIAIDEAGNREAKSPTIEVGTYIPDFDAPETSVTSVDSSDPDFEISVSGVDSGGSGLEAFEVYVTIDGAAPVLIDSVTAGEADAGGVYSATLPFAALSDGVSHEYRFFSVGIDARSNREADPVDPEDVTLSAIFDPPSGPTVIDFDVQNGATQRSFVQTLDVTFDGTSFGDLIASLDDGDADNDRIRLLRFANDGSGPGVEVDLSGKVSALDEVLTVDFGAGGIGGIPSSSSGDGVYRLQLDLDGDGSFDSPQDADLAFYRLFGDATGDRIVNADDIYAVIGSYGQVGVLDGDLDGDGIVGYYDYLYSIYQQGQSIAGDIALDD